MSMIKDKEKVLKKIDEALEIAYRIADRTLGDKWTARSNGKANLLVQSLSVSYDNAEEIPATIKEDKT